MIDDVRDLLTDTVRHARPLGRDRYGRVPAWSPDIEYGARVVYRHRLVRSRTGEFVATRGHAWIFGADDIALDDRITLPDGSAPTLLAVERYGDEAGGHHHKVFFE